MPRRTWQRLAGLSTLFMLAAARAPAGPSTNVAFLVAARVAAAQEQQYRERQILDPETDEWVDRPVEPAVPADELDQARALLAREQPRAALRLLEAWLKANPEHPRHYEGLLLAADAQFKLRRFYQAYERYEQVVENTGGELFRAALAAERDVALAFLSGQKRIIWRVLRLPAYDEAIDILDRIWERVPGTRLGEEALRIKAEYFYNRGDMEMAQDEYAHLAREYPNGRFAPLAMLRSAGSAEAAFPGTRFDARPLVEAEERYRQLAAAYPAYAERNQVAERLEGIRQQRADKDLGIARWYEKTGQPAAAEFYYRAVVAQWPDSLASAAARQRLRALGVELEETEAQP
jgi:outer membrane protein assembly factor BamD (BamD/ComL family)